MMTDKLLTTGSPTQTGTPATDIQSVSVSVVPIDESFFVHVAPDYWQWRELCEHDPGSRVMQHPDFVLAQLQHEADSRRHPAVLVKCHTDTSLLAVAVLLPKTTAGEKRFGLGWNLQGYRLAGSRVLGHVTPDSVTAFSETLAHHLAQNRADFLLIEDVETDAPVLDLLAGNHSPLRVYRPVPPQTRHRIQMPESFDEYMAKFTSRTRNTLRRKVKKFGECRLERISELEQLPDFLSAAHEISKNSWQGDLLGLRIHDDERELDCFAKLVGLQALRAYLLWHEDTPVSFCIGTQFNGVFDYEEVAYDRRFSKASPGQVLVLKMIEDLFASNAPRVFDFGGGDAEYKRQFSNSQSESGNAWLLRPGVRSTAIRSYFDGRRLLSQSARSALQRVGLMNRIRQLTRRGIGQTSD